MNGLDSGFSVIPVTSQIHAVTFAMALGGTVTSIAPFGAFAFFVGVDPSCTEAVEYCRRQGIKTVGYYIGSDSLCALQNKEFRENIPAFDVTLCVHSRIRNELAMWGVKSHVVWPCPRKVHEEQKIIGKCVGVYQPSPYVENDLYCFNECVDLANELPSLPFLFYGAKYEALPPNVLDAGRLQPEEVSDLYSKMSCVLRLVKHDGFPVSGIEAKMKGLHVIENYPYEFFIYADNKQHIVSSLKDQSTHETDKGIGPEVYRRECSPESFKRKVFEIIAKY